jgi:membrane protein
VATQSAAQRAVTHTNGSLRRRARRLARHRPVRNALHLVRETLRICLRYRVTGLAAEAGFFALVSLPPLVLGLAASAAWLGSELGTDTELQLKNGLRDYLSPFLTPNVVNTVIIPTLEDAIDTPRIDLISLGFVLSLWSGSRAMNVYIDTISIMYGQGGHRGIFRTRLLSFGLYGLTLALGAVTMPLVLVGPSLLRSVLPGPMQPVMVLYWPVVTVLGIALLTSLYHVSAPLRTPWRRDLPGALLALVIWVLASALLRLVLTLSLSGTGEAGTRNFSIYGPLTTPIVVLLWLYLLAIAVLIGAALNAAVDARWPARTKPAGEPPPHGTPPLTPVRDTEAEQWQRHGGHYPQGAAAAVTVSKSDDGHEEAS